MTDVFPLRTYQSDAVAAVEGAWQRGINRAAVVLPTGSGKTVVFAHMAKRAYDAGHRTLIIAHRDELLRQAADKLTTVAPAARVGIVKAAENEHQDAAVVVASVQTLARPHRRNQITGVGLVVVDEAHHAAADTYRHVMADFGCWRGLPTAGFTATMVRGEGGLAEVWPEVVYRRDILEMIADGHLVDPRGLAVDVDALNLDDVATSGGDFQDGALGAALESTDAAGAVAEAYLEHAADRSGVVFTPTVATAQQFAEVLTEAGIPAAAVWGAMPAQERAEVLDRYASGEIQVLTNCAVLTEGFDSPQASCVVIARPTRSVGLYIQMVGRVLRPFPGKTDALVLDLAGVSSRHRLASIVDLTGYEVPEPADGETLAEAAARGKAGVSAIGSVAWVDVDLFHTSSTAWLRTHAGIWFIPAGTDCYYLLVPGEAPQTVQIWRWTRAGGFRPAPDQRDLSLDWGMRWAEFFAERRAHHITHKDANWRRTPATDRQLKTARRCRIPVPASATKGFVSDAIASHFASRVIDPWATTMQHPTAATAA